MINQTPPIKIALIIDNTVVDVLHTDERFGAILLSEPTILDVTDLLAKDPNAVVRESTYNSTDGTFTLPQPKE